MKFEDARRIEEGAVLEADVCIAGAGAAGIALALELANTSYSVLLLESGGLEYDDETHKLYEMESTGDRYTPKDSRLRYFGGTTNHWEGFCRPLDPIDFEARSWIAHSGWPFGFNELAPHYERARALLGLKGARDPKVIAREVPFDTLLETDTLTTTVYEFAPVRFGSEFRKPLERAGNIRVVLNANVVEFESGSRDHLDGLGVTALRGQRFRARARAYVLALGGLENPRMLLASGADGQAALGNEHDLVGRYFTEHPERSIATLVLAGRRPDGFEGGRLDFRRAAIAFTPEALELHELNNIGVMLESWPLGLPNPEHPDRDVDPDDIAAVVRAVEGAASIPIALFARMESEPNPDSRVTLTKERDALGIPKGELHWVLSDVDRPRYRKAMEVIAGELGYHGLGFLRFEPPSLGSPKDKFGWGSHHMGTTRMHADPSKGVVDANQRMHAVDNLYVAGSSVFPTGGYSNPTLTILAMTMRLADHLRATL